MLKEFFILLILSNIVAITSTDNTDPQIQLQKISQKKERHNIICSAKKKEDCFVFMAALRKKCPTQMNKWNQNCWLTWKSYWPSCLPCVCPKLVLQSCKTMDQILFQDGISLVNQCDQELKAACFIFDLIICPLQQLACYLCQELF